MVLPEDINNFNAGPIPEAGPLPVGRPPATDPSPGWKNQPAKSRGFGASTRIPRYKLLNLMHRSGYSPAQIQEAHASLPEQVDSREHHLVLERYGLNTAARMERRGSSP